ncbi:MAG: pseudouridine synthase, partial [Nanoarchaeota archaeon]
MKLRLQVYLARAGLAPSRRKAEELIRNKDILVNGNTAVLGTKVEPKVDKVTIRGHNIRALANKIYIALNKPAGYLVAKSDNRGRKLAQELLKEPSSDGKKLTKEEFDSVFNIGRLDLESEGLLLFTNAGNFGDAIAHPRKHINKTYIAKVDGKISEETAGRLLDGVQVVAEQDGEEVRYRSRFRALRVLGRGKFSVMVIIISEGRKRQIRRTMEAVHHKVLSLKR